MIRKFTFFLLILVVSSCYSPRSLNSVNLSSLYKQSDNVFHPEINVWNHGDTSVLLSVKVNLGEFLFSRQADETFQTKIKVVAEIVRSYDEAQLLDSASSTFNFDIKDKNSSALLQVNLTTHQIDELLMKCTIIDMNKNYQEDFYSKFSIEDNSRNDFQIRNKENVLVFRNYFSSLDTIKISFRDTSKSEFWCKYYHRDFPLPPPPFSNDAHEAFSYAADSVFKLSLKDTSELTFPKQGFYHIQSDSSKKSGLTLFRFDSGYPTVSTPKQLLEPLRYLTSRKEYEDMERSPNLKSAVEAFWLARGGNEERTRGLIKKFYSRVQDANRFFASYTEGWKTDRGMVFIVFGGPNALYLSSNSESWTYGTPNSTLALNFFFAKVNNPFTDNDFSLSRSPIYEANWYRAVETWRQGRAYNNLN